MVWRHYRYPVHVHTRGWAAIAAPLGHARRAGHRCSDTRKTAREDVTEESS